MKQTIANASDTNQVFPGENWFYYWKTSASLWKDKIELIPKYEKVVIPLNWSFHSETGDDYDFGQLRPETDLFRLVSQIKEHQRTPVLFLPLGPAPFLPNGGLPPFLARVASVDDEQLPIWAMSSSGEINKVFSFFDQRVYRAFSKFTKELGHYLSLKGVDCDLWGIECGSLHHGSYRSFFFDRSEAYQEAFQKYLEANEQSIESEREENYYQIHHDFFQTIWTLYLDNAEKSLGANWEGSFKVNFLGASPLSILERLSEVDHQTQYTHEVMEGTTFNVLTSSTLLNTRQKSGVLNHMLDELVTKSMLEDKIKKNIYEDDGAGFYYPLRYFEVYDIDESIYPGTIMWADIGLWDFLQRKYNWCFADRASETYVFNESTDNERVIYFFHGMGMDQRTFNQILKTFMGGGKVILNRSGLEHGLLKRLETFFLENSLHVEKIVNICTVHNVVLGEGRLVIFEGDELADQSFEKMAGFWEKLMGTFSIQHLFVPDEEGLCCNWRVRPSDYKELEYEEIRRLSIYNPTSYKKKVKLPIRQGFSLMKVVEEDKLKYQNSNTQLDIELLPGGRISLDFGVYS